MDICVVGSGYVGLTSAGMLASLGHSIICVDKDEKKIERLQKKELPIFEPGLRELYEENWERIQFSSDVGAKMQQSPVIFIAVGTPSKEDGGTDLTYIYAVIATLSTNLSSYKTIITKSTVPPGTNEAIRQRLLEAGVDASLFRIVSNPEFLREGSAVYDMLHPDRTIVGIEEGDTRSLAVMEEMYRGIDAPLFVTSLAGAEMIKYTANTFLAMKISFMNEIARICDLYHIDINEVAKGIGYDFRINPHFLQAGIGYGGSCFPKDLSSLIHTAKQKGVEVPILQAVQTINETQVNVYIEKLREKVPTGKIAVLGVAFKPKTDDIRYSVALVLMEKLLAAGYDVHAYDPEAKVPASLEVLQHSTIAQAVQNADALIVATEWEQCRNLDFTILTNAMQGRVIVDGRNCLQPNEVKRHGFTYIGVGRI